MSCFARLQPTSPLKAASYQMWSWLWLHMWCTDHWRPPAVMLVRIGVLHFWPGLARLPTEALAVRVVQPPAEP